MLHDVVCVLYIDSRTHKVTCRVNQPDLNLSMIFVALTTCDLVHVDFTDVNIWAPGRCCLLIVYTPESF